MKRLKGILIDWLGAINIRYGLAKRYLQGDIGVIDSLSRSLAIDGAFSHDVTMSMLVFQNKEMAVMMVYQTNPRGIEL